MEWADRRAVEEAARRWTEGQKFCRTWSHAWEAYTVRPIGSIREVWQRCPRCTCLRSQDVDAAGYPLSPWRPRYPEGYLLRGVGRLGTDGKAVLRNDLLDAYPVTMMEDSDARGADH